MLNRRGQAGLTLMHDMAQQACDHGGMFTEKGKMAIHHMDEAFAKENISPGGTADLLAATWFVHRLETM